MLLKVALNPVKMFGFLQRFWTFLNYWYFRYMLVTELYMVEKWERNFINMFLLTIFSLFFLFNYKVLLPSTANLFVQN